MKRTRNIVDLMNSVRPNGIFTFVQVSENFRYRRVFHWPTRRIRQQILLRYIGYVTGAIVFRQQMIERLILAGPNVSRN